MSNRRLLEGLQGILLKLKDVRPMEATQAELIVHELHQREHLAELRHHYETGYELVRSRLESQSAAPRMPAVVIDRFKAIPSRLSEGSNWQSCRDRVGQLMECASALAAAAPYPDSRNEDFDTAVSQLLAWEVRGYKLAQPGPAAPPETKPAITPAQVRNALRKLLPGYEDVEIESFEPVLGGVSKVTIAFVAVTSRHGREALVLRGESLLPILEQVYLGMDLVKEYYVLRYLHRVGAGVAEPLALVDDPPLSRTRFFVSRRMPGRPPGDYLLRIESVSPALAECVASTLAYVHNIPVDLQDCDLLRTQLAQAPARTRQDAVREFILRAHAYWQSSGAPPSPLISAGVRWLLENVPASSKRPCIIHSDCGLNNFLVENDRVSAVVDWETARLSDPAEDVVWLLFFTGGALDEEHFLDCYVRAGGERPDPFAMKYYEVLARVRILFAQVDVQIKYERVPSANVILCAMALGQADKTVAELDSAMRAAESVKREMRGE